MGSANSKTRTAERRARIAEQRRAEQARERRNRILTISAVVVIVVALVAGGWYLINADKKKEEAKSAPIRGEKTWSDLSRNHVPHPVKYPMTPPVGGDHDEIWQQCNGNVYDHQLHNENAVHALEHGSVWVTYNKKASEADVKTLAAKVQKTPYSLMSPYDSQPAPITLSAWGHQLKLTKASDPRVNEFFDRYVQGPQTPEPGAQCMGGKTS